MGRVQTSYDRPGPGPPRLVTLTIPVAGTEDARVAELEKRVRDCVSKLCAEFGVPAPEVRTIR